MRRLSLAALVALSAGCMDDGDGAALPEPEDCDDPDRPAWLDWRDVLPDADGDGYGYGPVEQMCLSLGTQPPDGYVVAGPIDCAPDDASRWTERRFAGRDVDADGTAVAASGEICSGEELPAGHLDAAPAGALDCDDGDADVWRLVSLFDDRDADGHGTGAPAERCIGGTLPDGQAPVGGDCAPNSPEAWALLDYTYRDADGDGTTIPEGGLVCGGSSLPPGYATSPGPGGPDCDDDDPLRFQIWFVFPDQDGDGAGSGDQQPVCAASTLPEGFALVPGDCAPADPATWRLLAYTHRDADGDSYTLAQAGSICSGSTLPPGYRTDAGEGPDCDDADTLLFLSLTGFVDGDGDGHGAGEQATYCTSGNLPPGVVATGGDCAPGNAALHTSLVSFADADGDGVGAGPAIDLCTGGTRPPGFVGEGGDCAPADATAWRAIAYAFVDRDDDGRTVAESGQVCAGAALPPPYESEPSGNDCDDADPDLLGWAALYQDGDGDDVGAGERSVLCIGADPPAGLSIYGDDADDADPLIQIDQDDDDELELIILS